MMKEVMSQYAKARMVWTLQWLRKNHLKEFYDLLEESIKESKDPLYETLKSNLEQIHQFIESQPLDSESCNRSFLQ